MWFRRRQFPEGWQWRTEIYNTDKYGEKTSYSLTYGGRHLFATITLYPEQDWWFGGLWVCVSSYGVDCFQTFDEAVYQMEARATDFAKYHLKHALREAHETLA